MVQPSLPPVVYCLVLLGEAVRMRRPFDLFQRQRHDVMRARLVRPYGAGELLL